MTAEFSETIKIWKLGLNVQILEILAQLKSISEGSHDPAINWFLQYQSFVWLFLVIINLKVKTIMKTILYGSSDW